MGKEECSGPGNGEQGFAFSSLMIVSGRERRVPVLGERGRRIEGFETEKRWRRQKSRRGEAGPSEGDVT